MDTRQLGAFCAVVERKSFSQAAERLGVTQPAVSLQIRALEERLGHKLIDRSGRRVEPTEAGLALYRSAQRVLAAEEQLLAELAEDGSGELRGRSRSGPRPGPARTSCRSSSASSAREHPAVRDRAPDRRHAGGDRRVAERELELGVVGALRRHRSLEFEPLAHDEIVLAVPPGHAFAGRERPARRAPGRDADRRCRREPGCAT